MTTRKTVHTAEEGQENWTELTSSDDGVVVELESTSKGMRWRARVPFENPTAAMQYAGTIFAVLDYGLRRRFEKLENDAALLSESEKAAVELFLANPVGFEALAQKLSGRINNLGELLAAISTLQESGATDRAADTLVEVAAEPATA